ncbi:hypothetical protein HYT00_01495 [Candidatus Giovannonibacteria bacterium]|nr:hypothetical protein [Candidatus Giovannonibacteria bacterium]
MAVINRFLGKVKKEKRRGYYFFPEIPEERTVLMISVMQHEIPRLIVAEILERERKLTDKELAGKVSEITKANVLPKEIREYFANLLIPAKVAGYEVRHKSSSSGEFLFHLTKEGEKFALPVARFTSSFVMNAEINLGEIFGKDRELVYGRARRIYKILKALYESDSSQPQRRFQLRLDTMINEVTLGHDLERLERLKLVRVNRSEVNEVGSDGWEWRGGKEVGKKIEDELILRVASLLRKNRRLRMEDIVRLSGVKAHNVANAIQALSLLDKVEPFGVHPIKRRVEAAITRVGRKFYEEYPLRLYRFLSGGEEDLLS